MMFPQYQKNAPNQNVSPRNRGLMTVLDKKKLDGVASNATANSTAVTTPITNSGTALNPNIGIQAASGSQAGSIDAAAYTKLAAVATTVNAPLTNSGNATTPNLSISPATTSAPGSLSASDKTLINTLKHPTLALSFSVTTDLLNPLTMTLANTYYTLIAAQNFSVTSLNAWLQVELRFAAQVAAATTLGRYVLEALVDGIVVKLDSQVVAASGNGYLHGNFFHISGFTPGVHTIAIRARSDTSGAQVFLRGSSQAMFEYCEMRALEIAP